MEMCQSRMTMWTMTMPSRSTMDIVQATLQASQMRCWRGRKRLHQRWRLERGARSVAMTTAWRASPSSRQQSPLAGDRPSSHTWTGMGMDGGSKPLPMQWTSFGELPLLHNTGGIDTSNSTTTPRYRAILLAKKRALGSKAHGGRRIDFEG